MKLYLNHMVAIRDRAAAMANHFGIPDLREVRVIYPSGSHLLITPNPFVSEGYPDLETSANLELEGIVLRYEVRGVSRKYSEDDLKGEGYQYLIGDKRSNLTRLTENMTTWDLELQAQVGESEIKPFYL